LGDICKQFAKHEFLFNIPFDRFTAIMDLLLGMYVSGYYCYIVKNIMELWVEFEILKCSH
jgi:hypothetical protein